MGIPFIYLDPQGNRRVGPPGGGGGGGGGVGGLPPGGGGAVGKTTLYDLGYVDHRY